MRAAIALVTLVVAFAAGEDLTKKASQSTTIAFHPYLAALLQASYASNYQHSCAGSILNNRSVLTAARCVYNDVPNRWRFRLGSTRHNSGGTVYSVTRIATNDFDGWALLNDIAVVRTNANIAFGSNVHAGSFAGQNYFLGNNEVVTTAGWGYSSMPVWYSAQHTDLRSHEQATIATNICSYYYSAEGFHIRDTTQICSGFSNPGFVDSFYARDKCLGEPGAPLIHSGVIVGVRSYAINCNSVTTPTVSTRVGSYITWISSQV